LYYIHNDHLNTPQVITNQSQQVVWMGDYEPFGKLAANQNNSIEVFSRFPGQYVDSETGLYYNYFRDYDPTIGRYIESDPIGLQGGINTYAYVEGNPLSLIDPQGLAGIRIPWIPLPLPWIFPIPHQPNPGFDPTIPYDPTVPMPSTPHDGSAGGSTGWENSCPPNPGNQDPCKGLRKELAMHIAKLQQYISDPLSMDNKGSLTNAFRSGNTARAQHIINRRIDRLQGQIDNFKRMLAECEARHGK
ncbi:MAG TPA: RHS repeat-associated core domain-containing protein, partial [Cellvibrio sp.]|nr:RHS repeat-associated core domain-containing protein [Cellvibrio sp.]